jgi:hypothetical protein
MDTKSPLVTRLKKMVSPCSLAAASGLFLLIFLMASQELCDVLVSLFWSRLHNSLEQPSPERRFMILMRAESADPSSDEGPVHPGLLLLEIDVGPVPPAVPPSNGERFIVDMAYLGSFLHWKLEFSGRLLPYAAQLDPGP